MHKITAITDYGKRQSLPKTEDKHTRFNQGWYKSIRSQPQDSTTTEIRLLGYRFRQGESLPDEFSKDVYDQLVLDVFLERPLGYFIWEVYMPATFIVVISWTSFWLERSAIPARVSLGVTTVLSITTLLSNSNDNLPPTAYPKVRGYRG